MTANKRIFLNVAASYGKSMFGMTCGFFSTRWVLMALGQTDLGLYGLVGSLSMMVVFLNIQFSAAIGRFFAYSIGQAKVANDPALGLEECRRWFNVAVGIHTALPLVLTVVGYPIGVHLITHGYLVIPPEKIQACVWVWRFTCLSCFASMVNVPFQGMYTAKQYIAELTIYNVVQTAARTAVAYFMAAHPGEWLAKYAFAIMVATVLPQVVICYRAVKVFPECRFVLRHMWAPKRFWQVASFAFWQVVGSLGYVAKTSGVSVVVNRFFGPKVNASMGVSGMLAAETAVLTSALTGAFSPAITTAYGSGEYGYMRNMAYRACKFGTLLTLVFALPLALEVDEVLVLWLKDPPPCSAELCLSFLFCLVVEKLTMGHTIAVNASGKVALYQTIHGLSISVVLPVGILACLVVRDNIWAIGVALMGATVFSALCDVLVARRSVGLSPRHWGVHIVLPVVAVSMLALGSGLLPRYVMEPSFFRIAATVFCTFVPFACLSWFLAFDAGEKAFVIDRVKRQAHKVWRPNAVGD